MGRLIGTIVHRANSGSTICTPGEIMEEYYDGEGAPSSADLFLKTKTLLGAVLETYAAGVLIDPTLQDGEVHEEAVAGKWHYLGQCPY